MNNVVSIFFQLIAWALFIKLYFMADSIWALVIGVVVYILGGAVAILRELDKEAR